LTRRPHNQVSNAERELGAEFHRIRQKVLRLNGDEMARWLGIAKYKDGKETSSGKAAISRLEAGSVTPDEDLVAQYGRVPGVDEDNLQRLWIDAKTGASAADPGDHDAEDGFEKSIRTSIPAWRAGLVIAAILVVLAGAVVVVVLVSTRNGNRPLPGVSLVFDALGQTSDQTIKVYSGYASAPSDYQSDFNYHNGEKAAVFCKVQGRRVTSDPSAGERYRSTDVWIRIRTSTGLIRYATFTYARLVPASAKVPVCHS
jgi:hypothetical protein